MYKGIYAEKKTFSKFDNEHYLCYLNEQREEYSPCGNCPRHANRIDIAIIKTMSSKVKAVISKRWGTPKLWCKISK